MSDNAHTQRTAKWHNYPKQLDEMRRLGHDVNKMSAKALERTWRRAVKDGRITITLRIGGKLRDFVGTREV